MKDNENIKDKISIITNEWSEMTHRVLDLKRIPSVEIRNLFKKTYKVLNHYHKDEFVPKAVGEMLLEMDDFFYFASIITDNEFDDDPYLYQEIYAIAKSLKIGFFKGEYECEYPLLKVNDVKGKPYILDLQNGYIEDLFL